MSDCRTYGARVSNAALFVCDECSFSSRQLLGRGLYDRLRQSFCEVIMMCLHTCSHLWFNKHFVFGFFRTALNKIFGFIPKLQRHIIYKKKKQTIKFSVPTSIHS